MGLGELQACPFPDVIFPPLALSASSSGPFHCALPEGFEVDSQKLDERYDTNFRREKALKGKKLENKKIGVGGGGRKNNAFATSALNAQRFNFAVLDHTANGRVWFLSNYVETL